MAANFSYTLYPWDSYAHAAYDLIKQRDNAYNYNLFHVSLSELSQPARFFPRLVTILKRHYGPEVQYWQLICDAVTFPYELDKLLTTYHRIYTLENMTLQMLYVQVERLSENKISYRIILKACSNHIVHFLNFLHILQMQQRVLHATFMPCCNWETLKNQLMVFNPDVSTYVVFNY